MNLTVNNKIYTACPEFIISAIECTVVNSQYNSELWNDINNLSLGIRNNIKMEEINKIPAISATRQAYKKLGKDPNRYRPSAEALSRRIVKEMDLYKINTLVDLINLLSLKTGYSIGGFDADKIIGDIELGVGNSDDVFEGIGRGILNIEGLPVYRDEKGGIGTPTSDNERTKLSLATTHLLMIINGYSGEKGLKEATDYSIQLLEKYVQAANIIKLEIRNDKLEIKM